MKKHRKSPKNLKYFLFFLLIWQKKNKKPALYEKELECKECEKLVKNISGLATHIRRIHGMSSEDYYKKHFKKENEDIISENKSFENSRIFSKIPKSYTKSLHWLHSCVILTPIITSLSITDKTCL